MEPTWYEEILAVVTSLWGFVKGQPELFLLAAVGPFAYGVKRVIGILRGAGR